MNLNFWKKECKQDEVYVLSKDSCGKYRVTTEEEYNDLCNSSIIKFAKIMLSTDYNMIKSFYLLLSEQHNLTKELEKYIDQAMPKGYVDRLTVGDHTFINEIIISSTIPTTEDIKKMIEDPNIFYAVQGEFPHIVISKYTKVEEDSFNYCLRSEYGNLSLLPKTICFNSKADAVLYQNKLIQEAIENQKSKKK